MEKHLLLTTQKNEVLELLEGEGLNPREFKWLEADGRSAGDRVSDLRHTPSGFEFIFDYDSVNAWYFPLFRPSLASPEERPGMRDWAAIPALVQVWAACLKREIEAPDLWAAVAQEKALPASAASEENTPFTPEERQRLEAAVGEISYYVQSIVQAQEDQKQHFDRQFEYLRGAIDRMGKRDWLHTAVGVLTTIAFSIGGAQASDLFQFAWQQISGAVESLSSTVAGFLSAPG